MTTSYDGGWINLGNPDWDSGEGGGGGRGGEGGGFGHGNGGGNNSGGGGGFNSGAPQQPTGPTVNTKRPEAPPRPPGLDGPPIDSGGGGSGHGGQQQRPRTPPRPASSRTLTTIATGATIPVTYGKTTVGGNIIFARVVGQYFYIAYALGEGPINAVTRILIDGHDIGNALYQGRVGLGLTANVDYFVHLGGASQTYDTLLHGLDASHVTGWPGLAYVVCRFPTPSQRVGAYDPTRAVFEIEGKLTRDMRLHQPHRDPITAAAGSSGALTGTYYWKVTDYGSGWESAGCDHSNRLTVSGKRASLSNIRPSINPGAVGRKIYRTEADAGIEGPYKYVGTIADNTTTTFTDNVADGSLGDEIPYVNTEYTYSANPILHRYDLMSNVTFGGGIPERYIDGYFDGTFSEAADDCDFALTLPAAPGSAPTLTGVSALSNIPAGIYYYTVTNVDTSGNESLESPVSSLFTSPGARRIKVTITPVGGSIAKQRIYRCDANAGSGAPRHFVDEVADGTTSYIDNKLPEELTVAAPTQSVRYTMNLSLRDARTLQEWVDIFDQHCMAYGVYNSGVFQVFIDKAKPVSGLVFTDQGTDANIISLATVTLKGNSNNPNVITITFTDASREYTDGSASAETEAVSLRTEDKREKRFSLPGITSYDQAKRMAIHLLNRQHYADKAVSFDATPEAIRVLPGDIIEATSETGFSDAKILVLEVEPTKAGMSYRISGDFYSDLTYSDTVQNGTVQVPVLYPDPHAKPPQPPARPNAYTGTPTSTSLAWWDAPRVYRPSELVLYGGSHWSQSGLSGFTAANVNDGDLDNTAWTAGSGDRWAKLDLGSGNDKTFGRCTIHYAAALVADEDAKMGYHHFGDAGTYNGIEYSDDGSTWTVVPNLTRIGGQMAGDRYLTVEWTDAGAHRYWRVRAGLDLAGYLADTNSPIYSEVQFETFDEYPYVDHYDVYDCRQGGFSFFTRVPADARPTSTDGLDVTSIANGTLMHIKVYTISKVGLTSDDPADFDHFQLTSDPYGLTALEIPASLQVSFAQVPAADGVNLMRYMGAWSSSTAYSVNDVVTDSGTAFVCIVANTNHATSDTFYWTPIASGGGGGGSGTFVVETPSGSIDGSNLVFTIAHTPLGIHQSLFVNEAWMIPGIHYTRSGTTLTFVSGQAPDPGDVVRYQYSY